MTKSIGHALKKKFTQSVCKHSHKLKKKTLQGIGRGIGVNKLTDFAGSHYRDDGVRHIHQHITNINNTTHHFVPKSGNEINNLVRAD